MTVNVLFVCLGNICRSPTAHGVFQEKVRRHNLVDKISVDSAGTGAWHVGNAPDSRATEVAATRGYDLSRLRARKVSPADFHSFDYILAMDNDNLRVLTRMKPSQFRGELQLFLNYGGDLPEVEVPDPYYGGQDGFEFVLDLVESASEGLLEHIRSRHSL